MSTQHAYSLRELFTMAERKNNATKQIDAIVSHIRESGVDYWTGELSKNERITVSPIMDFNFDYRRVWTLCAVFFDDKPVMITQNAGREGCDWTKRYIVDKKLFLEMCAYVRSLLNIEELEEITEYPYDEQCTGYTDFYGNSLDGYFERY